MTKTMHHANGHLPYRNEFVRGKQANRREQGRTIRDLVEKENYLQASFEGGN